MSAASHPSLRSSAQNQTSNSCNASVKTGSSGKTLLFGEIPSEPQPIIASGSRTHTPQESNCRLILCGSLKFTKMWEIDACRDGITAHLNPASLGALRLVCHEMKNSVAPALFKDVKVTFNAHTFTKPRRLRALDRIGHHVQALTFNAPHTAGTVLPPLVDQATGEQLSFVYKPEMRQLQRSMDSIRDRSAAGASFGSEFGGAAIKEMLIRQYPPVFHAATNISSFVRALQQMPHLEHLRITCPGQEFGSRSRRSAVDYALVSLRMAVEQCALPSLEKLSLIDVHWTALQDLSPVLALGSTPRSCKKWTQIKELNMKLIAPSEYDTQYSEYMRLLQSYIRAFAPTLTKLTFLWMHGKGPCPIEDISGFYPEGHNTDVRDVRRRPRHARSASSSSASSDSSSSSASRPRSRGAIHFPQLVRFELDNATVSASYVANFIYTHHRSVKDFVYLNIAFRQGDWAEAFAPLERIARGSDKWGLSEYDLPKPHDHTGAPAPHMLNRPIFSLASMDCPLFISPSVQPLDVPRLPPLDCKRPFFEPLVEETLEPQVEPKHVGLLQSAMHRIFERQPKHEHTTESLTAAAAATAHLRQQHEERNKPPGHAGHLRQFIKNSLFHWR